jgi:hypothetical protein
VSKTLDCGTIQLWRFPISEFLDRRNADNFTAFNCGEPSPKALL